MNKKIRKEILARFTDHRVCATRAQILKSSSDPFKAATELSRLVTTGVLLMTPGPDDGKKPPFSSSESKDEFRLSPRTTPTVISPERARQRAKEREVRQIEMLRHPRTPRWRR